MTILPLITPSLKNFSNFGEGATSHLARLEEGSSAGLDGGLGYEVAFLLRTGRKVGVCLRPVSVEACSLSRTGKSSGTAGVSGFFIGEPSEEDTISSITGAPCFVELLLRTNPGAAIRCDFRVGWAGCL